MGGTNMQIPFNRPYFTGNDLKYIEDRFISAQKNEGNLYLSRDGKYTYKVQKFMKLRFEAKKASLMTSGTSALELARSALDFKQGNEVIIPSDTFSSTVNAILLAEANIDLEAIRQKLTPKTEVIYPGHYAVVSCDIEQIVEIAEEHDLKLVEDAAQGVNAKYNNKYLGTIGDFGCYSFHETKNCVCGGWRSSFN